MKVLMSFSDEHMNVLIVYSSFLVLTAIFLNKLLLDTSALSLKL